MAIRSKDFVGIAEGIRSHELSAKDQIEKLKGRISEKKFIEWYNFISGSCYCCGL